MVLIVFAATARIVPSICRERVLKSSEIKFILTFMVLDSWQKDRTIYNILFIFTLKHSFHTKNWLEHWSVYKYNQKPC
jgi:hypothetical protein